MEDEAGVPVEPSPNLGVLVRGVVVEDDMDDLAGGNVGFDRIEKANELLMAMALHAAADDLAFQDVERGKQGRGAMPLVVMRHRRAAALLHRQAGLGAVERLDLRFLVDRQHHRMRRRIDPRVRPMAGPRAGAKTDNVVQLVDELAVARQLELAHAMRLEPMGVPDPLHRADADPDLFGHHLGRPMGDFARRIGLGQRNRALVHGCRQPRDPRRPGLVAQQPVDPPAP
jgi:hypothetical protein